MWFNNKQNSEKQAMSMTMPLWLSVWMFTQIWQIRTERVVDVTNVAFVAIMYTIFKKFRKRNFNDSIAYLNCEHNHDRESFYIYKVIVYTEFILKNW